MHVLGWGDMARLIRSTARQWKLQVVALSTIAATIFFIIGAGLAARGDDFIPYPPSYHYLTNLIPFGSVRTHGVVMCLLAAAVLYGLPDWRAWTRRALTVMGAYATFSACLIFESWFFVRIDWSAPWWYVLVGSICFVLVRRSPRDFTSDGEGSERA